MLTPIAATIVPTMGGSGWSRGARCWRWLWIPLALVLRLVRLYRRYAHRYYIEEARIGLLGRHIRSVRLRDARHVNLRQGILERILGIGTLELSSTGGGAGRGTGTPAIPPAAAGYAMSGRRLAVGARVPTIRRLAGISLTAFVLLTLASLGAMVGGSAALHDAMETVSRDTRSAALASEIEAAVLMHQRLSNLYLVTGEAELDRARQVTVEEIRRALDRADALVGGADEQHLLDEVARGLEAYLAARAEAEARQGTLTEVLQATRGSLGTILADLRRLGDLNDAQVVEARAHAIRVDRWATWVAVVASALLIAGFGAIAWGVRRYLLRPVLSLHDAMGRFRAGDLNARAGGGGVEEVDDLARMFDDMAASLAQQRQAQLTFLAGVAHDLKSPLATLKTGVYSLAHDADPERRAVTRSLLDRQVDLLSRMSDDLLDAARIEAGELELRREQLDLGRLVQDMVRLIGPTAPSHALVAHLPELPSMVYADPLRIEQVVRNLVSNALKYSPEGAAVEVRVVPRDAEVELGVADRGSGIPLEEQETIFLPFRRRKLDTAPGTGLGLSVVRRIVYAHGGRIEVESEPGAGSIFRVILPAVQVPELKTSSAARTS